MEKGKKKTPEATAEAPPIVQKARDAKRTIVQKLYDVMADIQPLAKAGHNDHHRYDYITHGDVKAMMRGLFVRHGLFVLISTTGQPVFNDGRRSLTFKFSIYSVDADEPPVVVEWQSESSDQQDKGFNKIAVSAVKYWCIEQFKIVDDTVEDPDGENNERLKPPPESVQPPASQPVTPPDHFGNLLKALDDVKKVETFANIKDKWYKACKEKRRAKEVYERGLDLIEEATRRFNDRLAEAQPTLPATTDGYPQ